jgi:mannosyltransferase OCH1-like enzyme
MDNKIKKNKIRDKKIEKIIHIRKDIFIKNKYEIIKNKYNDDFHLVIYYIDENKCKIIVRRLDNEFGWDLNLLVKIYNEDDHENKHQILSIGSSLKNEKIIFYYTKIKLLPIEEYQQKIPKVIIQTAKDIEYKSLFHYNAHQTFLELNPEYEYRFFDNEDCREFIKDNFSENILDTYDILYPGAYKADLFRYCYIYINGGCYFDNKYILRIPLRQIIKENDDNIYCKDRGNDLMFNSIIISVKDSDELKKSIGNIVENVKNNFYGNISLEPTGPKLFNKYTYDKNVLLKHEVNGSYYKDSKILIRNNNILFANTHYKGYYLPNTTQEYDILFKKRMIYYKNIKKIHNHTILVYPHNYSDYFSFNIINNELIIKRIDKNSGWGQNLKIKLINNNNNMEYIYNIGISDENIFTMPFLL